MTWPPNNQPTGGKSDSTPMATDHPTEHNAIKATLDDIIDENAGALPLDGGGTVNGKVKITDTLTLKAGGSAADPAIAFDNVEGMGITAHAANNWLRFAVAGTQRVNIREDSVKFSDAVEVVGAIEAANGTRSAPSITFTSDTDTGMHRAQTDVIELVVGGVRAAAFGKSNQGTKAGAWIPGINYKTGVQTANVWVHPDAAQEGSLFRCTSSRAVMAEVETVSLDATDQVSELRPLWFRSNADADDPTQSHYGLAAEDVAAIDPRLATYITDEDGNTRPDDVNFRAVTALLVAEVQRQRDQIAELSARLDKLEA